MSDEWDTDEFPCPHCLVKALVEGAINFGVEPKEIASLVISGLKDGLDGIEGITIMTSDDMPSTNGSIVH